MVASAASASATYAFPARRTVLPRFWSTSTSSRSWSPGTTGRRNFTSSSDMKYPTLVSGRSSCDSNSTPPACASASTIRTPGMIG
jgi:hypothetical protein